MITYRADKGAPLSAEEMDGNFRELEGRLQALENHLESAENLGKILVDGDQVTFLGTFGTELGRFTLPKTTLRSCGAWRSQMPYQKLDLVTHENGLYCCEKDHQSLDFEQETSFWQEILAFPKISLSLPFYEKATIPPEEILGNLAFFIDERGPTMIFFDGKGWQCLQKGETL